MACFLIPTAEAIVTTAITAVVRKREQKDYTELGHGASECRRENTQPQCEGAETSSFENTQPQCEGAEASSFENTHPQCGGARIHRGPSRRSFSKKLKWLSNMLWGGSALLCFEHLWHGEVVPFPPFLTAASNPADMQNMLHEMLTVGICMSALVTAVWAAMVAVTGMIEKRPDSENAPGEVQS